MDKFVLVEEYQATEIQLSGSRSQLLYVFRSGNLLTREEICKHDSRKIILSKRKKKNVSLFRQNEIKSKLALSAKGSLAYGGSLSKYSNIGRSAKLQNSTSSLKKVSWHTGCLLLGLKF